MGHTLFISDLHLCETRPKILIDFITWVKSEAVKADSLYILGDLFEYWAGDDALNLPINTTIMTALKCLQQSKTALYVMHGNRDFLMAQAFCQASGAKLISDPSVVNIYGQSVLISHGDALCTDDVDYMAFRKQVRQPQWQLDFLAQPLANRLAFIADARAKSDFEKSAKSMTIMDVNQQAVDALLIKYGCPPIFIHGHTHRPAKHKHIVENRQITRYVLGDWYEQGSCLMLAENGEISKKTIQFD